MQYLRGWMYVVGALYLVIAFLFSPPMAALVMPELVMPGLGASLDPGAQRVVADSFFLLGAVLAVLGFFLLKGADSPQNHRELVRLVIGIELFSGPVLTLHAAIRGYGDPATMVMIAIGHGIIALMGQDALRRFRYQLGTVKPVRRAS